MAATDAAPRSKGNGSWASSDAIRKTMRGCTPRDTRPELALRSAAHGLGLRFRVAARPIPGLRRTADLVFPRARLAVFLDGCFWHGCPDHYTKPVAHASYWAPKIERNRQRDAETDKALREAGWSVLRIWQHEPTEEAAVRVRDAYLRLRRTPRAAGRG